MSTLRVPIVQRQQRLPSVLAHMRRLLQPVLSLVVLFLQPTYHDFIEDVPLFFASIVPERRSSLHLSSCFLEAILYKIVISCKWRQNTNLKLRFSDRMKIRQHDQTRRSTKRILRTRKVLGSGRLVGQQSM
jgi:hypothetical protein